MSDGFTIDASEVQRLALDLSRAASESLGIVEPVLKHGAQNIKDEMAADAAASQHFSSVAPSISYDRIGFASHVGYEIGPEIGRFGGSLGDIAYFGGAHGGGGTLDIDAPLRDEEPRLVQSLARALGDLL
jgi:hypothetical protein